MEGQTVSHYRILEKIGAGGMGEVYLAEDTSLERKVALKFLPVYLQTDDLAHKRFIREAKSAAALDHPFICKVYEAGESDGKSFIAMEFVEGQTLHEKMEKEAFSLGDTLRIALEISEALEKAQYRRFYPYRMDLGCVSQPHGIILQMGKPFSSRVLHLILR